MAGKPGDLLPDAQSSLLHVCSLYLWWKNGAFGGFLVQSRTQTHSPSPLKVPSQDPSHGQGVRVGAWRGAGWRGGCRSPGVQRVQSHWSPTAFSNDPPLVWEKIPSILEAARSRGKEVATWAAVSSESRGWSWRVIYSLWGGERAGDPEKGTGQGELGHGEDEEW